MYKSKTLQIKQKRKEKKKNMRKMEEKTFSFCQSFYHSFHYSFFIYFLFYSSCFFFSTTLLVYVIHKHNFCVLAYSSRLFSDILALYFFIITYVFLFFSFYHRFTISSDHYFLSKYFVISPFYVLPQHQLCTT